MISRLSHLRAPVLGATLVLMGALAASAVTPANIARVSVGPGGVQGDLASFGPIGINTDGRYVAFASDASNFYGLDANDTSDVFVRDRVSGFTEYISRADSTDTYLGNEFPGQPGNNASTAPSISGDGRFVAFQSDSDNLMGFGGQFLPDINSRPDVYVRDRRGSTRRISGSNAIGSSFRPLISRDGKTVAFTSTSFDLTPNNLSSLPMVYTATLGFDANGRLIGVDGASVTNNGAVERMTDAPGGTLVEAATELEGISADGRFVLFHTKSKILDPDAASGTDQLYMRDRTNGTLTVVSRASDTVDVDGNPVPGEVGDGDTTSANISGDGRFVVFVSAATNLVDSDTNDKVDVFVRDLQAGTTERVSVDGAGDELDEDNSFVVDATAFNEPVRPAISDDGRIVVFASQATNLVGDDNNLKADVFVRDRQDNTTTRISTSIAAQEGDADSHSPAISPDGRFAGFASDSTNLVDLDTNGHTDVFLSDLGFGGGGFNGAPTANAGPDQDVFEQDVVTLDGTGSSDPNSDPLTFTWTQISGPHVDLSDPNSSTPTFTAPTVATSLQLIFQLSVTDGVNPAATDRVTINVNTAAEPGIVTGTVRDGNGNAVVGATIDVVRDDGQAATETTTNGVGLYTVSDVRVGNNTLTVSAEGFEPVSVTFTVSSGQTVLENITLDQPLAQLQGTILLADGSPLVGATVDLLDGTGNIIGSAQTDGAGEYHIDNLNRTAATGAGSIRIRSDQAPEWVSAGPNLTPSQINTRDFRYGTLVVTVTGRPLAKVLPKLNGTTVQVLIGDTVILSNRATKKVRRLTFNNVPAVQVRVRGSNPRLTGAVVQVSVLPGPTVVRATIVMRKRGIF